MSDRSIRAERERYVNHIRKNMACVSRDVLIVVPLDGTGLWRVRFANDPIRLPTASELIYRAIHDFRVEHLSQVESPSIRSVGYHYELRDSNDEEVFAYHLHPTGLSHVTTPHLHVHGGSRNVRLDKRHLVTGVVTFPDIIRCLITEFDVAPLRSDWRSILESAAKD